MAFIEEWVNKKNKTSTTPGDKLNADDLNLLASGVKEALAKTQDIKIPTKVSDLEDADAYATKDYVNERIPDYKALNISGNENGGYIGAMNSDFPYLSFLHLYTYTMKLSGYSLDFDFTKPATGLKVETPSDDDGAVNKGYVDNLVGDVETALDGIIEMQKTLIGGEA